MLNVEIVLKINLNPTKKHLADIENWLIEEWNKTGNGFYSNWEMISEAFTEKKLSVITENNYAIGFVAYRIYDLYSIIEIVEIKPSERRKDIARKMIDRTLQFFQSKGVLAVELFCSPESSEPFWKKIGFQNFPESLEDSKINMFKPLVETLQTTNIAKADFTIKLWDCESCQTESIKPKWIWDLNLMEDNITLINPIIFPVSSQWQMELIKKGEKLFSDKIKWFSEDIAGYSNLMIIRKICV